MKRDFVKIGDKLYPRVHDEVLIGDWKEIEQIPANTIKPELGTEKLDGLILKGYEMKWGETNENFEQYEKTAFDQFIAEYFVAKGLNMPMDINHGGWHDWHNYAGRVLYIETNSVGFYFVAYIPRTYADYDRVLWGLKNGILQGFSKEGYATEWEYKYNEDGTFSHELIKSMKVLSVSLVSLPANGVALEKMQEVKNGLVYVKKDIEEKTQGGKSLAELFNNK